MATTPKKPETQAKDTVRKGKHTPKANTQRFMPIAEIKNDTVILKNGGMRAVLAVQTLNFNLKSETEQKGIIAGYEAFVNTITFPVQIVVRSTKVNIDPYIDKIRKKADEHTSELLRLQTSSYADFIEKLVEVADIMQKKFYVVVPMDDEAKRTTPFTQFFSWLNVDDNQGKANERYRRFSERSTKLKDRVNLVQSGLHNIGLITKRLSTEELIELYYQIYNPQTSQEQKLLKGQDLNMDAMTM